MSDTSGLPGEAPRPDDADARVIQNPPERTLASARSFLEQMLLLTDVPTEVSDAALDDLVRAARGASPAGEPEPSEEAAEAYYRDALADHLRPDEDIGDWGRNQVAHIRRRLALAYAVDFARSASPPSVGAPGGTPREPRTWEIDGTMRDTAEVPRLGEPSTAALSAAANELLVDVPDLEVHRLRAALRAAYAADFGALSPPGGTAPTRDDEGDPLPNEAGEWVVGEAGGEFTVSNGLRTYRTEHLGDAERLCGWLGAPGGTAREPSEADVEALANVIGSIYPDIPLKVPEYSSAMSCEWIAQRLAAKGVRALSPPGGTPAEDEEVICLCSTTLVGGGDPTDGCPLHGDEGTPAQEEKTR
jgi:hypothetical protein